MKKVFLSGDSIRIGYDYAVKNMLADVAEVSFSEENCRYAENTLRFLHEWKNACSLDNDVDCVHWNVGLWDCLIIFDDGPLTPIDVYGQYMDRICRRIQMLFPNAKHVFATSTPVSETGWKEPQRWFRSNADIRAYNEVACGIVEKYGMAVNDLYGLLADKPESWHSDTTHFYTKDATVCLTRKVAGAICDAMGIAVPEKTDEEILDGMRPAHKLKIFGI